MNDPGAEPSEDAGRQVRAAAIQAVQTGLMVSQYQRGRAMDRRAAAEHEARQARAQQTEARDAETHAAKMQGYTDRTAHAAEVHQLELRERMARMARGEVDLDRRGRMDEAREQRENDIHGLKAQGYADRAANTTELHQLAKQEVLAKIARGQQDLQRRNHLGEAAEARDTEIHGLRKDSYGAREAREAELHALDKQERLQRMAIRARAAGLSEQLTAASATAGSADTTVFTAPGTSHSAAVTDSDSGAAMSQAVAASGLGNPRAAASAASMAPPAAPPPGPAADPGTGPEL